MTHYTDIVAETKRVALGRHAITQKVIPVRYLRAGVSLTNIGQMIIAEHDWKKRMDHFRVLYSVLNAWADAGLFDYMRTCPHDIMDFEKVMTPIEKQFWHESREMLSSVWPQYPIGRFISDFAIPVLKIAVECDGWAYHDAARDEARDVEMARMGWTVYRVTGSQCNCLLSEPDRLDHEDDEEYSARYGNWARMTLGEVVGQIRARLDDYRLRHMPAEDGDA